MVTINGCKLFLHEVLNAVKQPKVLISVLVVILVPLLYSALFLWAFWDPYARMDKLPVAVVNMDEGASLDGKNLNVGQDLIENLKGNKAFDWRFTSRDAAESGLSQNKYYMVVEIPENFTKDATTVMDKPPQPAQFRFIPNESYNFLASQIGESAMERVKEEVNNTLTEAYSEAIFENIETLAQGLDKASGGAQKLADGSMSATSGAVQVKDNLYLLAGGTRPIKDGIAGLEAGSGQAQDGLQTLNSASQKLAVGVGQLHDASGQLVSGAQQSQEGMENLQQGLNSSLDGMNKVQAGTAVVAQGLEQYAAVHPELAQDPQFQQLLYASQSSSAGMGSIVAGQKKLAAGASSLVDGQERLAVGSAQLSQKLGEAERGSQAVNAGAGKLYQGSQELTSGLNRLGGGFGEFSDNTYKLAQGSDALSSGMTSLSSGSQELASKLEQASSKVSEYKGSPETYQMFGSHVLMEKKEYTKVPNYGTGFAPYFLSLGLFVGALILTIVISLTEPAGVPKSAFSWYFAKTMVLTCVGIVQAVVADLALLHVLGVQVQSVPLFYLYSILTSLAFMALIQFFVTLFDNPGRFIAIVILILQLISSAGTFPLEMVPRPLQIINAWLPMTYSIGGLKAVISSGNWSFMWYNAKILMLFIAIFCLGTLAYFSWQYRREFKVQAAKSSESSKSAEAAPARG